MLRSLFSSAMPDIDVGMLQAADSLQFYSGNPCTSTGVHRSKVVPSPNWPFELLPQHQTLSSAFSAQV